VTFDCIGGACTPRPPPGASCASGRCAFANCDEGRCVPHEPGVGDECAPNLYYCDVGLRCTDAGDTFVCTERCP
jgi:hypothetical protein